MAVLGLFSGQRIESSGRSPLCKVGTSNEGRCSSMANGLSNDGKWVFNKACTMPWCHTVGHFEVNMSRFCALFQDDHPDRGGKSLRQAVFLQRCFAMLYARLGPSSVLVHVLITELGLPCRRFTPLCRVQGCATHFSSSSSKQPQQHAAAAAAACSSMRSKSLCDHTVAENRHPSRSKRPGSKGASPQTGFVPFQAVLSVLWPI